jgi:hypothetical protein
MEEQIIQKNIINVECGKPLTIPLAVLRKECQFLNTWRNLTYRRSDEGKAYQKVYQNSERQQAIRRSPEYRAKQNAYQKARYQRKKQEMQINKMQSVGVM